MPRLEGRRALLACGTCSVVSGAALAAIRVLADGMDDFSTYRHPSEPWLLAAHRWSAPLVYLTFGWTIGDHVSLRLRLPQRRTSGILVTVLIALVTVTGILIQNTELGNAREESVWVHATAGTCATVSVLLHRLKGPAKEH